jgi:hypothetical protein
MASAVFALLGLLLAFTFYGAAARLDKRRELIVEEANAIGTAYLRVDLLPSDFQPEVRERFRSYVDSRLEFYKRLTNADIQKQVDQVSRFKQQIWEKTIVASQAPHAHPDAGKLLLPSLNAMFDIATTRVAALEMHPPVIVFAMLFGFAFTSSTLAGRFMIGPGNRLSVIAFAGVMAIAVYVILDLEYPRFGLIRVDSFDQFLLEVRRMMN